MSEPKPLTGEEKPKRAVWLDGQFHVATHAQVDGKWGGIGFACALCGATFKVGDRFRWVYMNGKSPSPGNFLVCPTCDHAGLEDQARQALVKDKPHYEPWVLLYMLDAREREIAALQAEVKRLTEERRGNEPPTNLNGYRA